MDIIKNAAVYNLGTNIENKSNFLGLAVRGKKDKDRPGSKQSGRSKVRRID
jgi:hypothetical protein